MAKDKDDVTPEVTTPNSPPPPLPATTRPGFSTQVTDAPDHNPNQNPNTSTPSQRVQDEQAAGRASIRDAGRSPAATGGSVAANPADADPARAAEIAIAMNAAHAEQDLEPPAKRIMEGEVNPGEVPSRGYPYQPLEGEEATQGTAAYKTADPRLTDPDTDLGQQAEGRKLAREAEEARANEAGSKEERDRKEKEPVDYKEKMVQQRDKTKK